MFSFLTSSVSCARVKSYPLEKCQTGRMTYYDYTSSNMGTCGYGALTGKTGPGYVYGIAPNEAYFSNSFSCGECYEVVGSKGAVRVMVVDKCPSKSNNCRGDMVHFDMTIPAFEKIEDKNLGRANMTYRKVSCDIDGNIKLTIADKSNLDWISFILFNHVVGVKSVYIKVSGSWKSLKRTEYNAWAYSGHFSLPLPIRVTSIHGNTVESSINQLSGIVDLGKQFTIPSEKKLNNQCCSPALPGNVIMKNGEILNGYEASGWGMTFQYNQAVKSLSSSKSVKGSFTDVWGGVSIYNSKNLDPSQISGLSFEIKTSINCKDCLGIASTDVSKQKLISATAGEWKKITISDLSSLGINGPFNTLQFQAQGSIFEFYIDDFKFLSSSSNAPGYCAENTYIPNNQETLPKNVTNNGLEEKLPTQSNSSNSNNTKIIGIAVASGVGLLAIVVAAFFIIKKRKNNSKDEESFYVSF